MIAMQADIQSHLTIGAIVRQGKGCVEDIGEALLKLRASSISYENYLMEKKLKNSEEG